MGISMEIRKLRDDIVNAKVVVIKVGYDDSLPDFAKGMELVLHQSSGTMRQRERFARWVKQTLEKELARNS